MLNLTWIVGGMAGLAIVAYLAWDYLKPWFADSETLFWGRLQILIGTLMATNLAPIIPVKYLPYYVMVSGIVTEIARRSRTQVEIFPDKLRPNPKE